MRVSFRSFISAALLAGLTSAAHAIVPPPALVAAQGDSVGSTGLTLESAGPPAIDDNAGVAFRATVTGTGVTKSSNSAMLFYRAFIPTVVARTDAHDPITGGTFTKFTDPNLSGSGAMAFIGTLRVGGTFKSTNDQGIYLYQGDTLSLPVRKGDLDTTDFTNQVDYDSFAEFNVADGGGVSFLGNIRAKTTTAKALYGTLLSGSLGLVAFVDSEPVSEAAVPQFNVFQSLKLVGGQGRSISPINGNVSIFGDLIGSGSELGIALNGTSDYNRNIVLGLGETAPFTGTKIKFFDEPAINATGSAVTKLTLTGTDVTAANDSAIVQTGSQASGDYVAFLRTGSTATDGTGGSTSWIYTKFSDPVINNNEAFAFIGTLKTSSTAGVTAASDSGIWSNGSGALELVARKGEAAPGTTGTFSSFTQLVLPDIAGPFFEAKLSGVPASANTGLWSVNEAQIPVLVVATGEQLNVHGKTKTVKSFSIFPVVPYTGGQTRSFSPANGFCVFEATFTDKTWGLYLWPTSG